MTAQNNNALASVYLSTTPETLDTASQAPAYPPLDNLVGTTSCHASRTRSIQESNSQSAEYAAHSLLTCTGPPGYRPLLSRRTDRLPQSGLGMDQGCWPLEAFESDGKSSTICAMMPHEAMLSTTSHNSEPRQVPQNQEQYRPLRGHEPTYEPARTSCILHQPMRSKVSESQVYGCS